MKSYFLDGKEARDDDYIRAIEMFPDDDIGFVRITIPNEGILLVSSHPAGYVITNERLDGSSWLSPVLDKEQIRELIELFLDRDENWRGAFEWELFSVTTKDAAFRTSRILLIGAVLIALALWLVRLFTN